MSTYKLALFGSNGHQVIEEIQSIAGIELVAVCGLSEEMLLRLPSQFQVYDTFEELVHHPGLQVISICSPIRQQQVDYIRAALHVGLHVYAEKPMVLQLEHLTELQMLAQSKNLILREMASTFYEQPYVQFKQIVASSKIGEVVQVFAQKSYPYASWRPQDEAIDGGLMLQAGIHVVRSIEHVTGLLVQEISAIQTQIGNPIRQGQLHMAVNFHMRLTSGAIAIAVINYLNVASSNLWGNDRLTVFGTEGYAESNPYLPYIQVFTAKEKEHIDVSAHNGDSHFYRFIQEITGQPHQLLSSDVELHPLRVVLTAKQSALQQGKFLEIS